MKAVVAAFNQEKALERAFSVITNLQMELFQALYYMNAQVLPMRPVRAGDPVRVRGGQAESGGQGLRGRGQAGVTVTMSSVICMYLPSPNILPSDSYLYTCCCYNLSLF